jgi:hypothetical protein
VTPPVQAALVVELRRLGRLGVSAAEARRRIAPLAAKLGTASPGYTTVLELIQESRPPQMPADGAPGILDSLVVGRFPTPRELDETLARARVHMNRVEARREERRTSG